MNKRTNLNNKEKIHNRNLQNQNKEYLNLKKKFKMYFKWRKMKYLLFLIT